MKTPEEIAREIVKASSDASMGDCPLGHADADYLVCDGCLVSMIAAAIVAERPSEGFIRRVTEYLARRDQVFAVGADLIEYEGIARDIAAIVAERTPGTTDHFTDPIAFDVDEPAPAPACARCGGSGVVTVPCADEFCPGEHPHLVAASCPECRGKP